MAKMFGRTLFTLGVPAGADQSSPAATATNPITGDQFKFCKFNGSGSQVKCSVAGERSIGILQDGRASGADVEIEMAGISPLVLGGTVTEGDLITADANAKGVTITGSVLACGGVWANARAMASGVSGDVIPVQVLQSPVFIPFLAESFFVSFTSLDNATIFTFTPGYAGKIVGLNLIVQVAATTGGKTASAAWSIAGTPTTGGVLALDTDGTTTDPDTIGKNIAASAITALNSFTAAQALTFVCANTTNLAEGSGTIRTVLAPT